jgi:protein-disulfide isomerase
MTFVTRYVRTGKARYELRILAGLDPAGSPLAARAALCAGEQSAFWEMVDELFQLQLLYGRTAFTTEHITDTANEALNLNTTDLASCMNSNRYQEGIQHSIDLTASLRVNRLPAILIRRGSGLPEWITWDGQTLTGQISYETLSQTLDAMLIANQSVGS